MAMTVKRCVHLRDIYARVGMDEKMLEVSAKLKSME